MGLFCHCWHQLDGEALLGLFGSLVMVLSTGDALLIEFDLLLKEEDLLGQRSSLRTCLGCLLSEVIEVFLYRLGRLRDVKAEFLKRCKLRHQLE